MSVLIFFIVFYVLLSLSLYLLFPKAGVEAKKGLIPGVNFAEWCKIIGRKPSYAFRLLIPIVNIFIFAGMAVDLVRSFNKLSFLDSALAVIYAPAAFFAIASNKNSKYAGPILDREAAYANDIKVATEANDNYKLKNLRAQNPYKKSPMREWVESIVFAVFAAAFIRMFLIEAYVIPTPSMEGSLNVGDFLFVSKAHYGIRTPQTVAMIPLLHNRIPILNKESYFSKPSLPYFRLPALEKIESGKHIVFNWPAGDSVYITPSRSYFVSQIQRQPEYLDGDPYLPALVKKKEIVVRPVDKRDHYIKRCIAVAGDSLKIVNKQVYINGIAMKNPTEIQYQYIVYFPENFSLPERKFNEWNIHRSQGDIGDRYVVFMSDEKYSEIMTKYPNTKLSKQTAQPKTGIDSTQSNYLYVVEQMIDDKDIARWGVSKAEFGIAKVMILSEGQKKKVQSLAPGIKIFEYQHGTAGSSLFPFDNKINKAWTIDNFGPLWIPKAGVTVPLSLDNLPLYTRVIGVYELNKLAIKDGKILINGKEATSYTFKQNYYWAMGDNRHNSEDSRMWGFVPEDHIVGKPLFIWFSTKEGSYKNGINWNRIFTSADKN